MMKSIAFVLVVMMGAPAGADSPLTSTRFWKSFLSTETNPQVKDLILYAHESVVFTPEMLDFLSDTSVSMGAKLALINAAYHQGEHYELGLSPNAQMYKTYLERKYSIQIPLDPPGDSGRTLVWELIFGRPQFSYPEQLNVGELVSLGYLLALDNYLVPRQALNLLRGAIEKAPRSLATHVAWALSLGNMMMNDSDMYDSLGEMGAEALLGLSKEQLIEIKASFNGLSRTTRWGYIYGLFQPLIERQSEFDLDLPQTSFDSILEYIRLYKAEFEEWQAEHNRFQKTMSLFRSDCESYLVPNQWTQPKG